MPPKNLKRKKQITEANEEKRDEFGIKRRKLVDREKPITYGDHPIDHYFDERFAEVIKNKRFRIGVHRTGFTLENIQVFYYFI